MPMVGTGDADSNAIANTNNGANDCQHKAKLLKVKYRSIIAITTSRCGTGQIANLNWTMTNYVNRTENLAFLLLRSKKF